MPIPKISKELKNEVYFLTLTTIDWIDIFTSEKYFALLIRSLNFVLNKYNGKLFGYVIMTNHIHLILSSIDTIKLINSFKTYTSKILKDIIAEDHRNYFQHLIQNRIWQRNNWPEIIETEYFFEEKLNYIHQNPVIKGFVRDEQDWVYSSSINYQLGDHSIIDVDTSYRFN